MQYIAVNVKKGNFGERRKLINGKCQTILETIGATRPW